MKIVLGFVVAIGAFWAAQSSAQTPPGKPIVAIYQMDDVAQTGQADAFSRMIETSIAATNKFRIIERERLGKLVGEQARAKSGLVTTNRPGRVGGFEGADFLIYGSITNVSVSKKSDLGSSMLGSLFAPKGGTVSCSNAVATVSIDIKITDADTGEIRYVRRIDETQKSASACNGAAQVDTSLLLRSAADKIAAGIVTAIYPIQIASVQADGTYILNYGEGSVQPGATMSVFTKGEVFVDPATGEKLGNSETLLGLIRVTDVTARFSKALPVAGFATAAPIGAIVRGATPTDLQAFKRKSR